MNRTDDGDPPDREGAPPEDIEVDPEAPGAGVIDPPAGDPEVPEPNEPA